MKETTLFKNSDFEVKAFHYILNFKFPFKLALSTRSHTDIVILKIKSQDHTGYGEAALPPYLGATVQSTIQFYKQVNWNLILNSSLEEALRIIDATGIDANAAKASIDIALHDLQGQRENISIKRMYGLTSDKRVISTYTIGISNEAELKMKLAEGADFKIIKLKLGSDDDKELIKAFRRLSPKPFCVDVNQGYKSKDKAAEMSEFLRQNNVLFIEQPLPAEHLEEMDWVRDRVDALFIADESVKRLSDLDNVAEAFDGVNIKLMKSTGIAEAYEMISHSRKLNLKVVLGAMAESSLGNTASAHIATLADWVDLDGPMLTSNDPFDGIKYANGAIELPDRSGVGAVLKMNLLSGKAI